MKTIQTLYRMATNAPKAAARVVKAVATGQPVLAAADVQAARAAICAKCPDNDRGRCVLCGCSTCGNILNKTKLATEKCPVNKWDGPSASMSKLRAEIEAELKVK